MLQVHQSGDIITAIGPGPLPHLAAQIAALAGTVTMAPADAEIKARLAEAMDRAAGYHERIEELVSQADESAGVIRRLYDELAQAGGAESLELVRSALAAVGAPITGMGGDRLLREAANYLGMMKDRIDRLEANPERDRHADALGEIRRLEAKVAELEEAMHKGDPIKAHLVAINTELDAIADRFNAEGNNPALRSLEGLRSIASDLADLRPLIVEHNTEASKWAPWRLVREAINIIRADKEEIAELEAAQGDTERAVDGYQDHAARDNAKLAELTRKLKDAEADLHSAGLAIEKRGQRNAELEAKLLECGRELGRMEDEIKNLEDRLEAASGGSPIVVTGLDRVHVTVGAGGAGTNGRTLEIEPDPAFKALCDGFAAIAPHPEAQAVETAEEESDLEPETTLTEDEIKARFERIGLELGKIAELVTPAGREVLIVPSRPDRWWAPGGDLVVRVYRAGDTFPMGKVYRRGDGWRACLDSAVGHNAKSAQIVTAPDLTMEAAVDVLATALELYLGAPAPAPAPEKAWEKVPASSHGVIWPPDQGVYWKAVFVFEEGTSGSNWRRLDQIQSDKGKVLGLIHRLESGHEWLEPNNPTAKGTMILVAGSSHAAAILAGDKHAFPLGKWVAVGLGSDLEGEVISYEPGAPAPYRIRTEDGRELTVGLWGLRSALGPTERAEHDKRMADLAARARADAAEKAAPKAKPAKGEAKAEKEVVTYAAHETAEGGLELRLYKADRYWKAISIEVGPEGQQDAIAKAIARAKKNYKQYKLEHETGAHLETMQPGYEGPTFAEMRDADHAEAMAGIQADQAQRAAGSPAPSNPTPDELAGQALEENEPDGPDGDGPGGGDGAPVSPEVTTPAEESIPGPDPVAVMREIEAAPSSRPAATGPLGATMRGGFNGFPCEPVPTPSGMELELYKVETEAGYLSSFSLLDRPRQWRGKIHEAPSGLEPWLAEADKGNHVSVTRHPSLALAVEALVAAGGYAEPPAVPVTEAEAEEAARHAAEELDEVIARVGDGGYEPNDGITLFGAEEPTVARVLEVVIHYYGLEEAEVLEALEAAGYAADHPEQQVDANEAIKAIQRAGLLGPEALDNLIAQVEAEEAPASPAGMYEDAVADHTTGIDLEHEAPFDAEDDADRTCLAAVERLKGGRYLEGDGRLAFGEDETTQTQARYLLVEVLEVPADVADVFLAAYGTIVPTEALARVVAARGNAPAPSAPAYVATVATASNAEELLDDGDRVALWETASKEYGMPYPAYKALLERVGVESSHLLTYAKRDELLAVHLPAWKEAQGATA